VQTSIEQEVRSLKVRKSIERVKKEKKKTRVEIKFQKLCLTSDGCGQRCHTSKNLGRRFGLNFAVFGRRFKGLAVDFL
jgi:hypothetical protein